DVGGHLSARDRQVVAARRDHRRDRGRERQLRLVKPVGRAVEESVEALVQYPLQEPDQGAGDYRLYHDPPLSRSSGSGAVLPGWACSRCASVPMGSSTTSTSASPSLV